MVAITKNRNFKIILHPYFSLKKCSDSLSYSYNLPLKPFYMIAKDDPWGKFNDFELVCKIMADNRNE
jgi:hypothetical protein